MSETIDPRPRVSRLAYVTRQSAERQARYWARVAPTPEYDVVVGDKEHGRYPLIWVPKHSGHGLVMLGFMMLPFLVDPITSCNRGIVGGRRTTRPPGMVAGLPADYTGRLRTSLARHRTAEREWRWCCR